MENRYKRLGKNTFLVLLGNASSKLISVIMLPLYTRWLSVSDYGITDIISVYSTLLGSIVVCCIYDAILVFPKGLSYEEQKKYFSTGISFSFFSLGVASVFFFIISLICNCFRIHNSFIDYIWYVYILFCADIFFRCIQSFCRSIDKLIAYSVSGVVVTFFTALFAFVFIPSYGVFGYVIGIAMAHLCGALYAFVSSKSWVFFSLKDTKWNVCKKMLKYSIPLIPNAIMWWIVIFINRPFMEKYVGFEGIGLFAVANKFPGILTMFFSVFLISWQLSVLEEFGKDGYGHFYNRIFKIINILSSVIVIFIAFCSRELISLFTDEKFFEAWQFIPLLSFGILFSNIAGFVGCNFSASKESKYYFYSSIWSAFAALIANSILIPLWGIWGAAISTCLSFFVGAVSRIIYSWRYVKIYNLRLYILLFIMDLAYIILVINVGSILIQALLLSLLLLIHFYFIRADVFLLKKVVLSKWV